MSVKEIASELNLKPNVVFRHILDLRRYELIEAHEIRDNTHEIRDNTPTYIAKVEEGGE